MTRKAILLAAIAVASCSPAFAQTPMSRPQPLAPVNDIPAARDIPFTGTMTIAVDATDLARGIYRVRQTVPVQPNLQGGGRMTMLYPEWLLGNHAPRGPIASLAGLTVSAGGRPIRWQRNRGYVFGFDFDVPAGAREIVSNTSTSRPPPRRRAA